MLLWDYVKYFLQSIFSTRLINILLFIFLFLVSIGAAEEKHVRILSLWIIVIDEKWKA